MSISPVKSAEPKSHWNNLQVCKTIWHFNSQDPSNRWVKEQTHCIWEFRQLFQHICGRANWDVPIFFTILEENIKLRFVWIDKQL